MISLRHVGLAVTDMDNALELYRDIFKLEVVWDQIESGKFIDYEMLNVLTSLGSSNAEIKSKYVMMTCILRGKNLTGDVDYDKEVQTKYVDAALNTLTFADSVASSSDITARKLPKTVGTYTGGAKGGVRKQRSKKRNRVYGKKKTNYKRKNSNRKRSKLRSRKTLRAHRKK